MYHINPRYIKGEEGVRIGKILDRIMIGEGIDHLVEKEITIAIEVMDEIEVILEEVVLEVEVVVILVEIIIEVEIEEIGGLEDNQDPENEE